MRRTIAGWGRDEVGDWFAELSCQHTQHVRHRPPFRVAPWVQTGEGRAAHLGAELECPRCDRAEMPDGLTVARTTDTWDENTLPVDLRRAHRVAAGRWALLHVVEGRLRFHADTDPPIDRRLGPGDEQPIPPEVDHAVTPDGAARFYLEFLGR